MCMVSELDRRRAGVRILATLSDAASKRGEGLVSRLPDSL